MPGEAEADQRTQALLRFQRRLGVETSSWDKATIDVFDGVSWQNVYTNPASSFSDASWVPQEIDITPHVAGRNNVRLRFGIESDSSVRYCGWNVDALDVYQASACADGAVGVPPVADGRFARGVHMIARKTATPGALTVSWEAGRCPADTYHLLWGRGTHVAASTYQGAACALGVSGTATTGAVPDPAPGAFNWWLIAGVRGTTEGHHGFRSNGTVRPASGVGRCSISAHDGAGTCP